MNAQPFSSFPITPTVPVGAGNMLLMAGPCVIESESLVLKTAEQLQRITADRSIPFVFKASFDKANRTSASSYRGAGLDEGLCILQKVKEALNLPVVTDVHETTQVQAAAQVVDVLQIPAFLCRQTDLIMACAQTGKAVNIKKGQYMAPEDMNHAVQKARETGSEKVMLTERGTSFGYHDLVVDMRGLAIMRRFAPVIFDATHSVQQPGGLGGSSGGQREFVLPLARAAAAVGVDGFFVETHPDPANAMSDGPNMIPLDGMPSFLDTLLAIHQLHNRQEN
jgi:2-dehydro-3-deoxyphosphooctonate aldolase (KDO 8-P synthase)